MPVQGKDMNQTLDMLTKQEKEEYYKGCNKFIHELDRKRAKAKAEIEAGVKDDQRD